MTEHRTNSGFTILELVLALGTLAFLGFFLIYSSTPRFVVSYDLDTAARTLVAELHYAQSLAQNTGFFHGFKIDTDKHYIIYRQDDLGVKTIVESPHNQQPMSIDITQKHPGVLFKSETFPLEVVFKPNVGSPPAGGGLSIMLENTNGQHKQITITDVTGRIDIE